MKIDNVDVSETLSVTTTKLFDNASTRNSAKKDDQKQ